MMVSENVRMAVSSVRKARLRSFFTMLGIIIGVVSVVTIVSLGEGVKHEISGQINQLGNDIVTVRSGKLVSRDENGKIKSVNLFSGLETSSLTAKDVETLKANSNVESAVPFSMISGVPKYNNQTFEDGVIIGTNEAMPEIVKQKVEFGNFFTLEDNDNQVAVIGADVAAKLFHEAVPIGKTFQLHDQNFIVKGVFERFDANPTTPGADFNNAIFVSSSNAKLLNGSDPPLYQILVKPKDAKQIDTIVREIQSSLKINHAGASDFTVLKQDEMLYIAGNILNLITKMIVGMAAVTLFVGGIGIMNVMLVSVSERNREIGIRKAIGATNTQIRTQFMVEAAVLSVQGVIVGLFASLLVHLGLRLFTNLEPVLTWQPMLAASIVSIIIGIVFGVIPAVKAARKDPIDALRPS